MRYWISVYLPLLPLEALAPCWSEPVAVAVISDERVHAVSRLAQQAGVHVGLRANSVAAISPETILLGRNLQREAIAMEALSLALLQFTPELTSSSAGLLLDVTASLKLFGGHAALCRRVRRVVRNLGFTCVIGTGPTANGALILSTVKAPRKHGIRRRVIRMDTLHRQLDRAPCHLLEEAIPYLDWLRDIGCDTLDAMQKLPRAGLQRRTNKELLIDLDRAYGTAPELFEWIVAPATFHASLELMDRIEHAEALLHGATGLLHQLIGWLTARQLAVTRIVLLLRHERGREAVPPTSIDITVAEPTWRDEHILRLLQERLSRLELVAPVIGLQLEVSQLVPMLPASDDLFPEPGGTAEDFTRLLELLVARLGVDNVLLPTRNAEHRPEAANQWIPATSKPPREDEVQESADRPFWILDKPLPLLTRNDQPFYGSVLKIVQGPERIESGWWDEQLALRDYYVAQGADASCYWIFVERTQPPTWFLHGRFG